MNIVLALILAAASLVVPFGDPGGPGGHAAPISSPVPLCHGDPGGPGGCQ